MSRIPSLASENSVRAPRETMEGLQRVLGMSGSVLHECIIAIVEILSEESERVGGWDTTDASDSRIRLHHADILVMRLINGECESHIRLTCTY